MTHPVKLRAKVFGSLVLLASLLATGCGTTPAARLDAAASEPAAQVQGNGAKAAPTREAFNRVRLGMTEAEVNKILGKPFYSASTGNGTIANWGEGDCSVSLIFEKGKLQQRSAAGLTQDSKKLASADPDRIKNGMTETDVVKLLGPSQSEVELQGQKVLIWDHKGRQITVHLHDGKVALKTVLQP